MDSGAGRNFRTGLKDNPYIRALIETIKEKQEKRLEAMEMGKTRKTAPSGLVDIRDIHVDKTLPREERISEFIRQIKNPYHFKCGKFTVQVQFAGSSGSLEDCLKQILR